MDRARDPRKGIWHGLQRCAGGAAVLVGVLLAGCTVKSPQVPRTDLLISLPVANDSTTIEEVVEDRSEFLEIDDEDRMSLNFTTDFGAQSRQEIGKRLKVTPRSSSFTSSIGDIRIPGQNIPTIRLPIGDLLPLPDVIPEVAIPISGTNISTSVGLELAGVTRLVIRTGGIDITVDNGLPVALNNLVLTLAAQPQDVVLNLGDVPPGTSSQGQFDLANATLAGELSITVAASIPDGEAIIAGDEVLEIDSALLPLIVEEATALIPQQSFSDKQVLPFPDKTIQIARALIDVGGGGLKLRVRNDIPIIMRVTLSLDDLKKPDGAANVFVLDNLVPGQIDSAEFDLEVNSFEPEDPLEMRLSYAVETVASDEEVTITSGGEIFVEAVTEELFFSSVEGKIDQLGVPIGAKSTTVDFPEGLNNIALASTSLKVFVTSGVGIESNIKLDIRGTNSAGENAPPLVINEVFPRGLPTATVSDSIIVDPDELTEFLNFLPTRVTVEPTVLVGDGQSDEVIATDHFVQVDSVVFGSTARFSIKADTRIEPTPIFRENQDEEARQRIESNLKRATAFTTITNHTPLGVRVSLRVAPDAALVYTDFESDPARGFLKIPQTGTFNVPAAPTDADGRVTQSVSERTDITLTSDEVLVFLREGGVYTGALVELVATGEEEEIEVFGTDFVNVVAGAEIVIELNEDLVE